MQILIRKNISIIPIKYRKVMFDWKYEENAKINGNIFCIKYTRNLKDGLKIS